MASGSLYRRILGDRFDALPEVLRRFHDAPEGGRARGTFRIVRARGRVRNGLATLLGLPEAGEDVPIRLQVIVEGDRERWVRHFHDRRLESVEWARDHLLMEAVGPTSFACALVVDGSCLRYEFQRAWFAGVPLPRRLAPYVHGVTTAGEGGWRVDVRIVAPLLGPLISYQGWIEPE